MGAHSTAGFPPGPQRDLVDALHGLHHRAGWPSLRGLAREVGCSHTTVSAVFSSPRLPTWGCRAAGRGDGRRRRGVPCPVAGGRVTGALRLNAAASARIAGRVAELATVRRHLDSGTPGLLLVRARRASARPGWSAPPPRWRPPGVRGRGLLPPAVHRRAAAADRRRAASAYDADHGQWLKEALTDAAPYLSASLRGCFPSWT